MEERKKKTIMVTGSEGFIGRNVVERLEKEGWVVEKVDRKLGKEIRDVKELGGIERVIHLGGVSDVNCWDEEKLDKDIEIFKYLCDLTNKEGVDMLYLSSAEAHPLNIRTPYGKMKYKMEHISRDYLNVRGIRLYNVYGRPCRENSLLGVCIREEIVWVRNGGKEKKYFTYIDDVVDGVMWMMENKDVKLINLYNPESRSVKDFIDEVRKYRPVKMITDSITTIKHQYVDHILSNVPLYYTNLEDGMKKIFS